MTRNQMERNEMMVHIIRSALLALALALFAHAQPAWGAPPANDGFANSEVLSGALPIGATGTNVEATKEAGEPSFLFGKSVWYSWTAASAEKVAIETCDSGFDTVLGVYTGDTVSSLTAVATNNNAFDCGAGYQGSKVKLITTAGTTYRIAVGGFLGASGPVALRIRRLDPPANDDLADALAIGGALPFSVLGSNVDATRQAGEPRHDQFNVGIGSVWYRWTPDSSDPVAIETCTGPTFHTLIGVYTGDTIAGLAAVQHNTEDCGDHNRGTRVMFMPRAGTTYRIAVDGFVGGLVDTPVRGEGAFALKIRRLDSPPNDGFAGAIVLAGALPITASGTNVEAVKEAGEPDHAGNRGGGSVWYGWTPASSGHVAIETCGSSFDTVLAVYTGDAVDALTPAGGNDDACDRQSRVKLAAAAGTTYRIAVDGRNGATGSIALRIRDLDRPANDDFAAATVLSGALPITADGTNVDATKEPGEPSHYGSSGGASVWYSWTPAESRAVVIDCTGDLLGVYTGATVDALTEVASSECRDVRFTATAGTTYWIAIDGHAGRTAPHSLSIRPVPANDNFANAAVLSGALPIAVTGTNVDASKEAGEPVHAGGGFAAASVWYSWTAGASGPVVVETCGSGFDTVLGVYTGDAVNALTAVASNDDSCGTGSSVIFSANAGATYRIAVDGTNPYVAVGQGEIELSIRRPNPPANDDLASATELSGVMPIDVEGTNRDASREAREPVHAGDAGGASVWYRWTSPTTDTVAIDTCGSDFDTLLAVYTGDGTLTKVASNDETGLCDFGDDHQSTVRFTAVAGETYRIAVDGYRRATGSIALAIRNRPANDMFADAKELGGPLPINATGTIVDATPEPDEPDHLGASLYFTSIWYSWKATDSAMVAIETCQGDTPTQLAVYTGDTLAGLTRVGLSGRAPDCYSATASGGRVIFRATAGTTYRIAIDRGVSLSGPVALTIRQAGPPANDDFAAAQPLSGSLPTSVDGTNVEATRESGEPYLGYGDVGSVWYRWTPEKSGPVVIETCHSDFSSIIGVYSGATVDALTPVDGTSRGCGDGWSVRFDAEAGNTYRIAVDGQYQTGGFMLAIRAPSPPANDDFAHAQTLSGALPAQTGGSNVDASTEPLEPYHHDEASVWYRWTPDQSGPVVIETCASDFDTTVGVYTGNAVHDLTRVASNYDTAGCGDGRQSSVIVRANAGTTYAIAVGGRFGAVGSVALTIRRAHPPANDDFADAQAVSEALPIKVTGTNVDASQQPDEPDGAGFRTDASVWYSWTPEDTGSVVVETCGSSFNPSLDIYAGGELSDLTEVAGNDNGCPAGDLSSSVRFTATAGVTYRIAVSGAEGATGSIDLTIRRPNPPANDDFANARVLHDPPPISITGTNVDASSETGEPSPFGPAASVWYRWTPSSSGPVVIRTCGDFYSVLAVYRGSALGNLVSLAADTLAEPCGRGLGNVVALKVSAGETYSIAVDGQNGAQGPTALTINRRPANDHIGNAQVIGAGFKQNVAGTNVAGSKQPGEPDHGGNRGGASVWYSWTPSRSGPVVIKGCKSGFPIRLAAYTGTAVNRLTTVAQGRDTNGCGEGTGGKLAFHAVAGATYLIAVDGAGSAEGAFDLTLRAG